MPQAGCLPFRVVPPTTPPTTLDRGSVWFAPPNPTMWVGGANRIRLFTLPLFAAGMRGLAAPCVPRLRGAVATLEDGLAAARLCAWGSAAALLSALWVWAQGCAGGR